MYSLHCMMGQARGCLEIGSPLNIEVIEWEKKKKLDEMQLVAKWKEK